MPVKLQQVVDHVTAMDAIEREKADGIVREVIAALGLSVANDGEVYSEAPKPAMSSQLRQQNVHWRGSRRR